MTINYIKLSTIKQNRPLIPWIVMGCVQVPSSTFEKESHATMISLDVGISGPWQKGRGGRGAGLVRAKDEDDELLRWGE